MEVLSEVKKSKHGKGSCSLETNIGKKIRDLPRNEKTMVLLRFIIRCI